MFRAMPWEAGANPESEAAWNRSRSVTGMMVRPLYNGQIEVQREGNDPEVRRKLEVESVSMYVHPDDNDA